MWLTLCDLLSLRCPHLHAARGCPCKLWRTSAAPVLHQSKLLRKLISINGTVLLYVRCEFFREYYIPWLTTNFKKLILRSGRRHLPRYLLPDGHLFSLAFKSFFAYFLCLPVGCEYLLIAGMNACALLFSTCNTRDFKSKPRSRSLALFIVSSPSSRCPRLPPARGCRTGAHRRSSACASGPPPAPRKTIWKIEGWREGLDNAYIYPQTCCRWVERTGQCEDHTQTDITRPQIDSTLAGLHPYVWGTVAWN